MRFVETEDLARGVRTIAEAVPYLALLVALPRQNSTCGRRRAPAMSATHRFGFCESRQIIEVAVVPIGGTVNRGSARPRGPSVRGAEPAARGRAWALQQRVAPLAADSRCAWFIAASCTSTAHYRTDGATRRPRHPGRRFLERPQLRPTRARPTRPNRCRTTASDRGLAVVRCVAAHSPRRRRSRRAPSRVEKPDAHSTPSCMSMRTASARKRACGGPRNPGGARRSRPVRWACRWR